jgi:hypothetical protein
MNAFCALATVSFTDFLHNFAAPTLPPVKCKTAKSCDAALKMTLSGGLFPEPVRYLDDRADNSA